MYKIAVILAIVLLFGCTAQADVEENTTPNKTINSSKIKPPVDQPINTSILSERSCTQAGGRWNECGSACRGAPPGTACILVCVTYCECGPGNDFNCPLGYSCQQILNDTNIGVCKSKIGEERIYQEPKIIENNPTSTNITVEEVKQMNVTATEGVERDAILFDKQAYALFLEDITIDSAAPKGACALVGIVAVENETLLVRAKICAGSDFIWVSPQNKRFRMRVTDIAPGYSSQAKWANILIFE